jgi:putative nucleotidyltransferase-like protein
LSCLPSRALPNTQSISERVACLGAPAHAAALLDVLQFDSNSDRSLERLVPKEWQQLFEWSDRRQLTLLLPSLCGPALPANVRLDIRDKTARYAIRFERLKANLFEIADAFGVAELEFVLLKGLSHAPGMTPDPLLRAQGDIDLWLRGSSVYKAEEVLRTLGYASIDVSKSRHLGPMARPNDWRWQGDLFDPDMPISVELHYELWSGEAEFIDAPGLEKFWARRIVRDFDGHKINVLRDQDLVGFSALHLLLHLLHGDLPLQRAWELARFLDTHHNNAEFWGDWCDTHCLQLRQLEVPMYHLVSQWFGCRLPECVKAEVLNLNAQLRVWLAELCVYPLVSEWKPNKREVWLHLALINSRKHKARLLLRRLFPVSLPRIPRRVTFRTLPTILVRYLGFVASRLARHLVTLLPTIVDGLRLGMQRRL